MDSAISVRDIFKYLSKCIIEIYGGWVIYHAYNTALPR